MSSQDLMNLILEVIEVQNVISDYYETDSSARKPEDFRRIDSAEERLPGLQDALSVMIADENVVAANRQLVELVKKLRLQDDLVVHAKEALDKSLTDSADNSIISRLLNELKQKKLQLSDLRNTITRFISQLRIKARGGEDLEKLKNLLRREVELKCEACESAKRRLVEFDSPAPAPAPVKRGWFGLGGRKTMRHKKRRNRQTRSRR